MKVILDITEDEYNKICHYVRLGLATNIDEKIVYAKQFMKNATNGEMIQELFPDLFFHENDVANKYCTTYKTIVCDDFYGEIDINWWNTDYKEEKYESD